MPTPESHQKLTTKEELETALNETAYTKLSDLNDRYGKSPELKDILEGTIGRIETERENFHRIEMNKILRFTGNTFEDVYDIFNNRIKLHCLDIHNAAGNLDLDEPKSGIHQLQAGIKKDVKKVA